MSDVCVKKIFFEKVVNNENQPVPRSHETPLNRDKKR